jgi:uncharacterized protein (DUF433 family)
VAIETDRLIEEHIEPDPGRPGIMEARLRRSAVPVWTLIVYWQAADEDTERVTHDYRLRPEEMQAAIAYYRKHEPLIDERIRSNVVQFE